MRAIKKALTLLLAAILIATSIPHNSIAEGPCGCKYVVQPGDSVLRIADRCRVDPGQLARYNGISNWNQMPVGLELEMPDCTTKHQVSPSPTPPPVPLATHQVQDGENLWGIAEMYGANPFAVMDLNGLEEPDISAGQSLIVPCGKPKLPSLPPTMGDYLNPYGSKLPGAIPGRWGVPFIFVWMITGGVQSSDNPAIRLEKAYPPIPDAVGWWPEPRHPLDKALPRYRQRITCWRIAQREATQPGGQRPCWCGKRDNGDGTVSYAFYFCEGPCVTTPLLTGGEWIKDLLAIINVGVSNEGVDMYQQSTGLSEPGKILDQFEEIECPEFEEVIKLALKAGARVSNN
ncbi:MAG TPA: LysM peptidoglycan-binding domain-containing protein [Clostridia bacterium]|nr:LysM peptidoglycan-binding domain-containing protein [Clostridia bacterium]